MAIKTARNDNSLIDTLGSKLPIAGGKILQIVRATGASTTTTTSTSFVDTGTSVTITPQKSDSAILVVCTGLLQSENTTTGNEAFVFIQITDSSNNLVSGGGEGRAGFRAGSTSNQVNNPLLQYSFALIGYSTPGTINATTYKVRMRVNGANQSVTLRNSDQLTQLFAIEVSA